MAKIHKDNKSWIGFISSPSTYSPHSEAKEIFARDCEANGIVTIGVVNHWYVSRDGEEWQQLRISPSWNQNRWYKYEPTDTTQQFIRQGETYWCVNLLAPDGLHEGTWEDTTQQTEWLDRQLVFKDKNRALKCAETLFTYLKSQPK